jgi:succinoglycan biosynthesis protein ExoU
MSQQQGTVSVIVAAFNAGATVGSAVASALALQETKEVILVNDASSDDTVAAATRAAQGSPKLKVISFPKNRGPAAARNAALEASEGEFVCVLDADDYFIEGRLRRLLDRVGDCDFIADDILIVPDERAAELVLTSADFDQHAADATTRLDLVSFIEGNIPDRKRPRGELGFLKPIMRRAFLERHGLRYDERLRLGEDYAFYVRSLRLGAKFCVTGPCGYIAIERATSLSSRHSAADLSCIVAFDAENASDPELTPRERAAFARHEAVTRHNANHRHALDIKKERGNVAGAAFALSHPSSLPYIIMQTLRAKSRHLMRSAKVDDLNEARARYLVSGQTILLQDRRPFTA